MIDEIRQLRESLSANATVIPAGGIPPQRLLESLKASIKELESRLERIEKLILEGNGKYIRESTQVLNAVAITMERLTKLEEKLAKNGFPVFDMDPGG
jgi:hypothetical protein